MSLKAWLSVVTFVLIAIIVFVSREELLKAWELLGRMNIWILLLLIPTQLIGYFAAAQMVFSYLEQKKLLKPIRPVEKARIALELNFVNHVLPSGGVSGISYMNWRLGKYGVTSGRATMAQIVRYAVGMMAFIMLFLVAVLAITVDGDINRWIILISSSLATAMIATIIGVIYVIGGKTRMKRFAGWVSRAVNRIVLHVTFGKKRNVLSPERLEKAFLEVHDDFIELRRDRRVLKTPLIWALVFTVCEVLLFVITFWALGYGVNPAPILIAYAIASLAGFIVITPGGTGAYEALMVGFLALAGIAQGAAIAGILVTRMVILVTTIGLGYVLYQKALAQNGSKHQSSR